VQLAVPQVDLLGLASTMRSFMKANVASRALVFADPHDAGRTSQPGCVIASPSYAGVTNQDYVNHWVRDSAIAAMELAAAPELDVNGVDRTLCDYVAFSELCQNNAPADHFFLACYQIDGTPRDWSDQKDGPALQSLAFVDAWPYLDAAARATAKKVAQRNVDDTVEAWSDDDDTRGPWEDVIGPSFFARAAQVRFLDEVNTSNALGLDVPPGLDEALDGLTVALAGQWSDEKGCYLSIPNGKPEIDGYDPNADVIMAQIYGSVACTDPKLLATAAKLRETFDVGGSAEYPINVDDRARDFGPMVGRYPGDTYDGDTGDDVDVGHPWAICTANVAQLCYHLATAFQAGDGADFDDLSGSFFSQVGLDEATVNDRTRTDGVATALVDAGDRMLQAVVFHSDHQHLSEQFDRVTGFEKSVQDLTWSYAAYLSAVRARP
jgi:glucoamylase